MTDDELDMLTTLTGEADEDVLSTYYKIATQKVLNILYPFGTTLTAVPTEHEMTLLEITAFMVNKRGAEGETSHSENGVNRSWGSDDIPTELLRRLTPTAGILK